MYVDAKKDAYYAGDYEAIERIIDAEIYGGPPPVYGHKPRRKEGKIVYIDPGEGAVEYARKHVSDLSREEAAPIIRRLLSEPADDRRVKICDYCGYPWYDDSLRNTKRTCCADCKTGIKTLQRRKQRADKDLLTATAKTKRTTQREEYYQWWHEYPFWVNGDAMLSHGKRFETSHDARFIDFISAKNEIYGLGNRKVKTGKPGAEDERMGRTFNGWARQRMSGF